MCPGKVPCGVAWDQSRFRPRTAEKSTAGDPVTLNACASLRASRADSARIRLPTRGPAASSACENVVAAVSGMADGK